MRVGGWWVVACAALAACGGDGGGAADATTDAAGDAAGDVAGDGVGDAGPEDADDATDAGGDAGPTCPPFEPPEPPEPSLTQTRFALNLFHFNIEYVPGGLEVVEDSGEVVLLANQAEAAGWDNDRVEDWIVTETFLPVLEIFARHPTWKVDLELQGRFIEVLAARHPAVLDLLRELAWAGQAEVISFHYSAQLFLAFPREDLERSIARTRQIFEDHCVPLSGTVFNQEGQAGLGRQRVLVEQGYEIGVFPKNLWRYQHGEAPRAPYYASEGGTLIVGPGDVDPASGVQVTWPFFDDGELRTVPKGVNPYLAFLAGRDEDRIAEYEQQLEALEADGWAVTSIGDYVRHLEAQGVEKPEAPPLVDGTWQPQSTTSIHRWLGGESDLWSDQEQDDRVRTGNAQARMHVAATQVLLERAQAEGVAPADGASRMAAMWDDLFKAQVSDASGVNPWRGEVLWSLRLNASLMERTAALRGELLAALGWAHASVDLATREAAGLDDLPMPEPPAPADAPLEVTVDAGPRPHTASWFATGPQRWQLQVAFQPVPDVDPDLRPDIAVRFPRTVDAFVFAPGLVEDEVVTWPFEAFTLMEGEVWLPLPSGLVGLGDGWWVAKHVRQVHVAARVAPERATVDFMDETRPAGDATTWVFEVLQGSEADALAMASRLNLAPFVLY